MEAKYIRKVQFTGKSTYIVSLPKKWALKHNLAPGSPVVVEERGSAVVIRPAVEGRPTSKKIVLDVNGVDYEAAVRMVVAAYIMGYDEIVLKSSTSITPQLRNAIRSTVLTKLLAVEILNEDASTMELHVMLSHDKLPLSSALKRLARITGSVLADACRVAESGDPLLAEEVLREDDSIDRAYFYAIRLINLASVGRIGLSEEVSMPELLAYRSFAKLVERIGDHAVNIARYIKQLGGPAPPEVSGLCREALAIFSEATEAFFEKNPHCINEISGKVELLRGREESVISSALRRLEPGKLLALKLILESTRRIAEYSKDIAEVALDLGLEKVAKTEAHA